MQLSTSQKAAIDRDNKQYQIETSEKFSDLLQEQLLDVLEGGSLGIDADANDVDSLAEGGGAFTQDEDLTTGLDFAFDGGRVRFGKTIVTVSADVVTLSASATNYVEVDSAGVVSANTSGFTTGSCPLYLITTGASTISTVVSRKTLLSAIPLAGIDGSLLSTPGKTKELSAQIGTIATSAGSTIITMRVPTSLAAGSKVSKVSWVDKDALAASDTNYVKWGVVNKGAAGAGTQVIADITAAANSTKVTGGTALAAYTPRDLTLATLTIGTERDVTGGDVLEITITAVGTLANTLTESSILVEFTFTN
jgi:hypothetical protein